MKKIWTKPKGLYSAGAKAYRKARYVKARVRYYGRIYDKDWKNYCSLSKEEFINTMGFLVNASPDEFLKRLFGKNEEFVA